jgi:hypothetical protein
VKPVWKWSLLSRRTVRAAGPASILALAMLVACGERYADVVVKEEVDLTTDGGAGAPPSGATGSGGGFAFDREDSLQDLCDRCSRSSQCGGPGDLCLEVPFSDDGYCGMSCNRDSDCPPDYECIDVGGPGDWEQCVPESRSCLDLISDPGEDPTTEQLRAYVFEVVNDVREERGVELLQGDPCLERIGQEAVRELETEGTFKTKFNRECGEQVPNCECHWQEESQAFIEMVGRTWQEAIRYPFDRAAETNPGGSFFRNVVSDEWTRIGIGIDLDRDYLRFSLEFAP